nr:protein SMG7-like isoform X1 [Rhipicephalus microplus]
MKASVSEILEEVETVKSALAEDNPRNARAFKLRTRLCLLLEELLLTDLEFALDKKLEQELWNSAFRNPIAAFQVKSTDKKERANGECHSMLSTLLETASGFYLQLFQKLCSVYDISFKYRLKDVNFGILQWAKRDDRNIQKPKMASVLYICQHCLVHLGDIARYRGQSLQAENFYRHAVDMGPRNGHPYNQLALLEAASGEKLSAVFFHVRSLALLHPFPAAATNLSKLYSKMVSDSVTSIGKTKMSPYEYTTAFLQFHAHIYLHTEISRAEAVLASLTSSLPALVMVEKLDTWQLLQMVAICMFSQQHCRARAPSPTDPSSTAGPPRKTAQHLLLDLVASMLHAFLLPMHALQDPRDMRDCGSVPVVKLVLDWLLHKQELLCSEPFIRKPQVWHGFCKLLNGLLAVLPAEFPKEKFSTIPLPEDWDVQCFTPLQEAHSNLCFENSPKLTKNEIGDLRASRLLDLAEMLSQVVMNGKNVVVLTTETPPRYIASHYTEAMRNQVMKQIQQLSIEPEGDSRRPEKSVSEVRFKLETDGHTVKAGEPEKRGVKGTTAIKDRRPTRNVAMQSIFQQWEQRNAGLADSHSGWRGPSSDALSSAIHNIPGQSNHNVDEKPWHHQHFPHSSSSGSRVNFNLHPTANGQTMNGPGSPLTFDPGVAPMPPAQPQPLFSLADAGGGQQAAAAAAAAAQQASSFVPGSLAGPTIGPSYLWNYIMPTPVGPMGATAAGPQPPPLLYMGTSQSMVAPQLENLLRQQQQHQQQQQQQQEKQLQQQQPPQPQPTEPGKVASTPADLYQGGPSPAIAPPSQPTWMPQQRAEVNGCQMVPPAGTAQTSGADLPTNTYSLFNSPWPSGLHYMAKEGGRSQSETLEPTMMHSTIQSLWSGPGPSPLERLLEQQKQWRDGAAQ